MHTGLKNAVVVAQLTTDNYNGGIGWTAAYGCADGFRGTSSTNNTDNPIASNLVIVPTDANGDFCVNSYRSTDLIVDLAGTCPARPSAPPTVCSTPAPGPALAAGVDRMVHLGPANAAVVAQFTTDNYGNGGTGWTAVFACAAGFQGTSSLNNKADPIASNLVIAPTDATATCACESQYADRPRRRRQRHRCPARAIPARPACSTPDRRAAPTPTPSSVHVGPANAVVVLQVTTDNYVDGDGWTAVYACADGFHGTSSLNNTGNPSPPTW